MKIQYLITSLLLLSSTCMLRAQDLILTGILYPGATPKTIELYVVNDIPDLSIYGMGVANNGGGTDGIEYTFPADAATAGQFIYLTNSFATYTTFYGGSADYESASVNFNGDDAIELFEGATVIDIFGDINVDGTGTPWDYNLSYAARVCGTGPDGSVFTLGNWNVAPLNNYSGAASNAASAQPFSIGAYVPSCPAPGCTNPVACNYDPAAVADDGSCVLIGDVCDDGNSGTENDLIQANCTCAGTPVLTSNSLILTGIIYAGAAPKAIELYVVNDIADLSIYGIGSAGNGGGTDGEEYTFPADAVTAGSFIYVANDLVAFDAFFGFAADYTDAGVAINFNGDDAFEIFENGAVIDTFGDIAVDGTGEPWEYTNSWAVRNCATGPDGSVFVLANWTFGALDAFLGQVDNATTPQPFPVASFAEVCPAVGCTNVAACNYDALAAVDDGSCILPGDACDDGNAYSTSDVIQGDCSCAGVFPPTSNSLILTGVLYPGATGKTIELYVVNDIPDLSVYGFSVANNGGGSEGQEYAFPADAATAGDFIYVTNNIAQCQAFYGITTTYESASVNFNGDDAVEVYELGQVIDVFGEVSIDGTGTTWEYVITWASRNCSTGPDGDVFVESNWTIAPNNTYTGQTTNAGSPLPFALGAYSLVCPAEGCTNASACNYDMAAIIDDGSCILEGDSCDDGNPFTTGDVIQVGCGCAGSPIPLTNGLILTGVMYPGGTPKAIEIYVAENIADLSVYGIGVASNGTGTDGVEFSFPAVSANAGDFIYLANDAAAFLAFYGFAADYVTTVLNFNGDDTVELFENGQVGDSFGFPDVDGTGTTWEYVLTWATRNCATGPDGGFIEANWTLAPLNTYSGVATNAEAASPYNIGAYDANCPVPGCTNPAATNYDPAATADDGSCIVPGCRYSAATNYNPAATIDDLSCVFEDPNNCPADINTDGVVNSADLLSFLGAFGTICN
jgi:hypothetical protein